MSDKLSKSIDLLMDEVIDAIEQKEFEEKLKKLFDTDDQ